MRFKKNTKESFEKAKKLVKLEQNKNTFLGVDSIVHVFFLAINQKDFNYAIKFLANNKKVHRTLFNNLYVGFAADSLKITLRNKIRTIFNFLRLLVYPA